MNDLLMFFHRRLLTFSQRVAFIGVLEEMELTQKLFNMRYNCNVSFGHLNPTEEQHKWAPTAEDFMHAERVLEREISLYRACRTLLRARHAALAEAQHGTA